MPQPLRVFGCEAEGKLQAIQVHEAMTALSKNCLQSGRENNFALFNLKF